jgi:hypothetical protein
MADGVPRTSPTAMDDLWEPHAAALSNEMRTLTAYIKGEASEEEMKAADRDLAMTTDLLERGLNPKEAGD